MSTIYIDSVNEYCRKYFVKGEMKITNQDLLLKGWRYRKLHAELFESLMLHEKLNFKVYGENIPLTALINILGLKNVEELIDRNALSFTLWSPMVGHAVSFVEGLVPVVHGRMNSGVHSDPQQSISEGLKWMARGLDTKTQKMITRKVQDLYLIPKEGLENDASNMTISAFNSNKTSLIGFDSKGLNIGNLNAKQRASLGDCASVLLEHKFLMSENFITNSDTKFSRLYSDSINKIVKNDVKNFNAEISQMECFPDLFSLAMKIEDPREVFPKVVKLRYSRNATEFREWIKDFSQTTNPNEITKAYLDAVIKPIGFLQTEEGRFVRSCVITTVGAGIGALAGPGGFVLGLGAGLAFDLLDEFFLSELSKGWSPRMFFDDMREFQKSSISQS